MLEVIGALDIAVTVGRAADFLYDSYNITSQA
jgi:hypothetical protein